MVFTGGFIPFMALPRGWFLCTRLRLLYYEYYEYSVAVIHKDLLMAVITDSCVSNLDNK